MLDHELVEFAATIPADVKFKSGDLSGPKEGWWRRPADSV